MPIQYNEVQRKRANGSKQVLYVLVLLYVAALCAAFATSAPAPALGGRMFPEVVW